MTAQIIDGKAVAAAVRNDVKEEVTKLRAKGIVPGLATVLVGARPDSMSYVTAKRQACAELGIESFPNELPETVSQAEVLALVNKLSADAKVNGILVQLPLPKHIDEESILNAVSINKDVDGFHPINVGKLGMKGREPLFAPCTPAGVIELLDRIGATISGSRAVVLGRSNIVGLPVSLLLLGRDATVTICHSRTKDLASVVRQADILVAAIGKPKFVTADMVKPGAYVIDVGVNSLPVLNPDGSQAISEKTGKPRTKLVGDVDFEAVKEVAAAITPVPGGVGPMTIAMLMKNTLRGAKAAHGIT
ncbi:MAG: bifunctional 5,10-methylene-tetrahydrofolate dehydrogenase/5,10-methylene-tetrahydrofolate cyclohydrolase [Chloroflexi bacterium]|nr:bifunctional 5,10-methylene-tetrahydrofolate dehydrogenase/5,10-methylene-tetrahydrofolate cyclohydrolase [Chloroflexota bacterium]